MPFSIVVIILLGISSNKIALGKISLSKSINDDLKMRNATCRPYDTCTIPRIGDSLSQFACHCGAICTQLGTCCADSPNDIIKPPKLRPTCRSLKDGRSYFMVDRCPSSYAEDSKWENLCKEEWNDEDDLMKIVPVTSLFSMNTYKNYYCFRCHEGTHDFLYWNLKLGSSDHEFDQTIDDSKVSLYYDLDSGAWMAPLGVGGTVVPVNLSLDVPEEISPLPVLCQPDVISRCADKWFDKVTREKCEAYMGVMYIAKNGAVLKYKNVHCASCNFEDLNNMSCRSGGYVSSQAEVPYSFMRLLDINRINGDKAGKIQKCEGNLLWDPYAQKCRRFMCALPGYTFRNGKCTPP